MKSSGSISLFRKEFLQSKARRARFTRLPSIDLKRVREQVSENWQQLALLGFLSLGLLFGARVSANPGTWQPLVDLFRSHSLSRSAHSVFLNAAAAFGTQVLFLLAVYLLGLCAAGLPFLLLLPLIRGLGLGILSGWLYGAHGVAGVGYCILVLYPAAVLSILVLLHSAKAGMQMSSDMTLLLQKKISQSETSFRGYSTRFLLFLGLSALASLLDALCFLLFSGLFPLEI